MRKSEENTTRAVMKWKPEGKRFRKEQVVIRNSRVSESFGSTRMVGNCSSSGEV